MNQKHYSEMVYDHINDDQIYEKTDSNCDRMVMKKIKIQTQKHENILIKLQIDSPTNF